MATLRSRTQIDRGRPLASDLVGHKLDQQLSLKQASRSEATEETKIGLNPRETSRPFVGLTQVCRLIRQEYRPIYLQKQEIGMDLTAVVKYLQTFYHDAPERLAALGPSSDRGVDIPYTGNVTIAVGDMANKIERAQEGVEVYPLLDLWANSFKIEAGFGRYQKRSYMPELDGEAKDL